jgi:hypothetical protein
VILRSLAIMLLFASVSVTVAAQAAENEGADLNCASLRYTKRLVFDKEWATCAAQDDQAFSARFAETLKSTQKKGDCTNENAAAVARKLARGKILVEGGESTAPIEMLDFNRHDGNGRTSITAKFERTVGVLTRSVRVQVLCEYSQIVPKYVKITESSQSIRLPRAHD